LNEIYVARPSLPSVEEYAALLDGIWSRRILTNRGPLLQQFEAEVAETLGVPHVSVVANATLGLIVALMEIGAKEVITTPFSFVATANSIRLAGAKPVFADIDPVSLSLDPAEVERKITPETGAILAVHAYGLPCDIDGFEALSQRTGIPVIYDAAHAFAVRRDGRSILNAGRMSVLSFHATKVFHSAEGGAIVCQDAETKRRIDTICNHGISDETTTDVVGMNAKMSELHAAMGLLQLRNLPAEIAARDRVVRRYAHGLAGVPGIRPICPTGDPEHNNYAYPIFVDPEYPLSRDALYAALRQRGIIARRYFHPLITDLGAFRDLPQTQVERFPVAQSASERVLCLPLYGDLSQDDQNRVIDAIAELGRKG